MGQNTSTFTAENRRDTGRSNIPIVVTADQREQSQPYPNLLDFLL